MNPADFIAKQSPALDILLKEHDVQLRALPHDVMIAPGKPSAKVLAHAAAADPMTGRVHESCTAFSG